MKSTKITFDKAVKLITDADIALVEDVNCDDAKCTICDSEDELMFHWEDSSGNYDYRAAREHNEEIVKTGNKLLFSCDEGGEIEVKLFNLTPIK